jgi:hypothetical protein
MHGQQNIKNCAVWQTVLSSPRRQAVQINRLHRHGSGMAQHSVLVESTASRGCQPDKISPTSVTVQPWQKGQGKQAHTFRRNSWRRVQEARQLKSIHVEQT